MKVAELGGNVPMTRTVSTENRGAMYSPTTMDTAPFDNKDRLREAMKAAERLSEISNRRLKFEYQEEAGVFQASVVDESNEAARRISAEGVPRMVASIERLAGLRIATTA